MLTVDNQIPARPEIVNSIDAIHKGKSG